MLRPRCKGSGTVDRELDNDLDIMVDCPKCGGSGKLPVQKIMIVGEAWGKDEEQEGKPFVGASGRLLNQLLSMAGIRRDECYVSNVLNLRPKPSNDIKNCCGPKAEAVQGMPAISPGKYLRAEFQPELDRLYCEVRDRSPNLIVALGATAAWAFLKTSGISKIRGSTAESPFGKVLPTYHPAAVLRDYSLRPIVVSDLHKAKREAEFPEVRRPQREVWIEPTLYDIDYFFNNYIWDASIISVDIETIGDMITCVGLAPSIDRSIVIPFFDPVKFPLSKNYWETAGDERTAWRYIKTVCERKRTLFQNGMYDIHFLWRTMGIKVLEAAEDTMLLHHALQPEMNKGLGFLGSIYSDEAAWKLMRKTATAKREE